VDIKGRTMSIRTEFKGKSGEGARNLSGGERSYTTVALVLAVWDKLLIPFYMLDEFDVFMDMANRLDQFSVFLQSLLQLIVRSWSISVIFCFQG